jgi:predicted DNA-binding protein with PD1-like motif
MRATESRRTRFIVGRLNRGDHLPDALLAVAEKFGVKAGQVHAIGGVTNLAVTEYDLATNKYRGPLRRAGMTEVLSLAGNLSLREGKLFGHLHISGCWHEDAATKAIAGHLVEAEVFVCEFHIVAYDDVELTRELDPQTGLALWNLPDKE